MYYYKKRRQTGLAAFFEGVEGVSSNHLTAVFVLPPSQIFSALVDALRFGTARGIGQ